MTNRGTQTVGDLEIRSVEAIPYAIPLIKPIKWARGEITWRDLFFPEVHQLPGS